MSKIIVFGLLSAIFLVSGCLNQKLVPEAGFDFPTGAPASVKDLAVMRCIDLCENSGSLPTSGLCLSDNNIDWNVADWVCDIAHSPRTEVDNLPENQCQEFRLGNAKHFVEVDKDCKLIRAV